MASLAELERPNDAVVEHIIQYYERNRDQYNEVWSRLDDVRQHYRRASKWGRIALLKLSYLNSVISIRTEVEKHEQTFTAIMNGQSIEGAFEAVDIGLPKRIGAAKASLAWFELWEDLELSLERGFVDRAHKRLLEDALWAGTVKAPFTLSNLGFTRKMCLDTNVLRLLGSDEELESSSVKNYSDTCANVQAIFPRLDHLEPYMLQWLLFDYQRHFRSGLNDRSAARFKSIDEVTRHDVWFEFALRPIHETRKQMERVTPSGEPHEYDPYSANRNQKYGTQLTDI